MTNTDDTRTPAEVIKDFTLSWVDGLEGFLRQVESLTAKAEAMIGLDEARWEDDGGPCRAEM